MQYQIVYYSDASSPMGEDALIDLLRVSMRNNSRDNITGCMIYANHRFIQLLEGEQAQVERLFNKIKSDSRHSNVQVAVEMSTTQRLFPNWSMAFKYLGRIVKDEPGLDDPAQWIYSEFNAESSPAKERIFNFAVRQGLMESQVLPK
jgi:hypothetical protein